MKIFKILSLAIVSIGLWAANWVLLSEIIYNDRPLSLIGWQPLATILGIIFLSFFYLINRNRLTSLAVNILIFLTYVAMMPKNGYVIAAGLVFVLTLAMLEQRLISESKARLNFEIRPILSASVSIAIYGFLLLIGLNIYYNTQIKFQENPNVYYDRLALAADRTVNRVVDPAYRPVADTIAFSTVDRIKAQLSAYEGYFPLIFALIVTALLGTFGFLIRWISIGLGWIIFKIFVWLRFFKFGTDTIEVQKLEI